MRKKYPMKPCYINKEVFPIDKIVVKTQNQGELSSQSNGKIQLDIYSVTRQLFLFISLFFYSFIHFLFIHSAFYSFI